MRLPQGLPEIRGPWLAGYRVVWGVVALLALYALTWGGWSEQTRRQSASEAVAELGLALEPAVGGYLVSPLTPEMREAGIEPYDDLVAVDGRPVSLTTEGVRGIERQTRGETGRPAVLSLVSETGERREVTVVRSGRYQAEADAGAAIPMRWQARAAWISSTAINLLSFLTGGMLFRRRASDPVAALLSMAFVVIVAATAWDTLLPGVLGMQANLTTAMAGAALLILGLLVFPSGRFDTRLVWPGLGLLALAVGWDLATDTMWEVQQALWMLALIGCAVVVIRRYFKLAPGPGRQQMKWSLLGLLVFVVLSVTGVALGWVQGELRQPAASAAVTVAIEVLEVLSAAALMGGLLISMLRHRLYDADAAISRSVSVGAVTIATVGVFAGAEKLVELVGEQVLGTGAASAIAAALAAVVVLPMHNRMAAWAESRFQGALARLKRDLPEDLLDLRATEPVEIIAAESAERVREAVQARRTAVLVASGDDWIALGGEQDEPGWRPEGDERRDLVIARDDLAYPVRVRLPEARDRTAGWLLVGPRPDGSPIGKAEREAVAEISGAIGRALASAARRTAATQALIQRLERLEQRDAARAGR